MYNNVQNNAKLVMLYTFHPFIVVEKGCSMQFDRKAMLMLL